MAKPLKQYTSQTEAIKAAKSRASGSYRTQYIYAISSTNAFSVRSVLEEANRPIIKVLYDGTVEHLEEAHVQP